jgi:hypothetical protein
MGRFGETSSGISGDWAGGGVSWESKAIGGLGWAFFIGSDKIQVGKGKRISAVTITWLHDY